MFVEDLLSVLFFRAYLSPITTSKWWIHDMNLNFNELQSQASVPRVIGHAVNDRVCDAD